MLGPAVQPADRAPVRGPGRTRTDGLDVDDLDYERCRRRCSADSAASWGLLDDRAGAGDREPAPRREPGSRAAARTSRPTSATWVTARATPGHIRVIEVPQAGRVCLDRGDQRHPGLGPPGRGEPVRRHHGRAVDGAGRRPSSPMVSSRRWPRRRRRRDDAASPESDGRAAEAARAAGTVMLVGHSLGGIAAAGLASSPRFTAGPPGHPCRHDGRAASGGCRCRPDRGPLARAHQDAVPRLDGQPNPDRATWVTVTRDLGDTRRPPGEPGPRHARVRRHGSPRGRVRPTLSGGLAGDQRGVLRGRHPRGAGDPRLRHRAGRAVSARCRHVGWHNPTREPVDRPRHGPRGRAGPTQGSATRCSARARGRRRWPTRCGRPSAPDGSRCTCGWTSGPPGSSRSGWPSYPGARGRRDDVGTAVANLAPGGARGPPRRGAARSCCPPTGRWSCGDRSQPDDRAAGDVRRRGALVRATRCTAERPRARWRAGGRWPPSRPPRDRRCAGRGVSEPGRSTSTSSSASRSSRPRRRPWPESLDGAAPRDAPCTEPLALRAGRRGSLSPSRGPWSWSATCPSPTSSTVRSAGPQPGVAGGRRAVRDPPAGRRRAARLAGAGRRRVAGRARPRPGGRGRAADPVPPVAALLRRPACGRGRAVATPGSSRRRRCARSPPVLACLGRPRRPNGQPRPVGRTGPDVAARPAPAAAPRGRPGRVPGLWPCAAWRRPRAVVRGLPAGSTLFLGSSNSARDVDLG